MNKKYIKSTIGAIIVILLTLLGVILTQSDALRSTRLTLSNNLYRPSAVSDNIVIVGLDDSSLNASKSGLDITDRESLATVFENLASLSPKVVGVDYFFIQPTKGIDDKNLTQIGKKLIKDNLDQFALLSELAPYKTFPHPSDKQLITALDSLPNKIFAIALENVSAIDGNTIPSKQNIIRSIPAFTQDAKQGITSGEVDKDDGLVRTVFTEISHDKTTYESFSLAIARAFTGKNLEIPTINEKKQMYIRYFGGPGSYTMIPALKLYNGTVKKSEIEGKIVLFGMTSARFNDSEHTPISPKTQMSGVEIHANALQTILDNRFIRDASSLETGLVLLIATTLLTTVGLYFPLSIMIGLGALLSGIYYSTTSMFFERGVLMEQLFVHIVIVLNIMTVTLYTYFTETKQKNFIVKAFKSYVSKEVLKQILKNPASLKLGGELREVTALFCDIKDFTNISEKLQPQELVQVLNQFFGAMSDIITESGGTVDKFEGDAIMAVFGAPIDDSDHAMKACMCALRMQAKLEQLRSQNGSSVLAQIHIRIGINTGKAVAGNIGSKDRFDYTVMGDSINLASRLEGANKTYGSKILIGESTYSYIKDAFVTRLLDRLRVKGKETPVQVYEIMALKPELIPQLPSMEGFDAIKALALVEVAEKHSEGMKHYFERQFSEAITCFKEVLTKSPDDNPAKAIELRCTDFLNNPPPPDWDGVYVMKGK